MMEVKRDGRENTRKVTEGSSFFPDKQEERVIPMKTDDPEVLEKPVRRRFAAKQKLRILKIADSCTESGSLGALLRREGLYASSLKTWRRQREEGTLNGLAPKKRGRKAIIKNVLQPEIDQLKKENEHLKKCLRRAETIIDVQKKISQILSLPLEDQGEEESK